VCRAEQLQPIYVNIRVNGDNKRNHQTKLAAVKYKKNSACVGFFTSDVIKSDLFQYYFVERYTVGPKVQPF
jgi:hypothetical protein